MSKFIDRLNRVARATPQPMGFGHAKSTSEKLKMLLVVSLSQANPDNLADYVTGADAGLLPISKPSQATENIQAISGLTPAIPWGVWLKGFTQGEIKPIVKAGCDFVVFPAVDTSLTMLRDDKVGKILEVEVSLNEGLLGTVNGLPVDAVLIDSKHKEEHSLTWQHLMLFQRFASLLAKPLLVSVPSNITANELQALWEAGVDGVIIEVSDKNPADKLKELRRAIDKLSSTSRRKRGKAEALLPYIGGETEVVAEEAEEEE